MSFFGWREHREYVMHRKRLPCVGLPRRLAANIYNPVPIRLYSRPSHRQSLIRPYACIYNLLPTNELYILLCFLALGSSLTDAQNVLLELTLSPLACDYAVGFVYTRCMS